MSVQVSYKKQFMLGIFFLICILVVFEIFSQVYKINEDVSCLFIESEIFDNVPKNSTLDVGVCSWLLRL